MRTCSKSIVFAVVLIVATPAMAGLKDIRKERLPQYKAVLKAYADMITVEDFVREWSDKWPYDTPKNEVSSLVQASLGELHKALESAPENEELLLLTGLVAHYANNVDVDGAYQVAVDCLEKAHKLQPGDYRPDWFLGVHLVQTNQLKQGMDKLLSIERALPWEQLPSSFWDDYIYCAVLANLPAHALRAGDHAARLRAQPSKERDFLLEVARKRFITPDPLATYSPQEVWRTEKLDSLILLVNSMFGFAFSSRSEWKMTLADVRNGLCMAQIKTGPHSGKTSEVIPNVLVLVRAPKAGETLSDFLKTFLPDKSTSPTRVAACPSQECLGFEVVKPESYKAEGGGHFLLTAFKREMPEFPDLFLEEPTNLPAVESEKATYFHPTERLRRLEGTLYYLVAVDTADSALEKAETDYEDILRGIRVE